MDILAVKFSHFGNYLYIAGKCKNAYKYEIKHSKNGKIDLQLHFTYSGHTDWIISMALSNDGVFLITGSRDKSAIVWNTFSSTKFCVYTDLGDSIKSVGFTPDDK